MDWNDLWAAFALYLVLEGLLPFLNPGGTKRTLLALVGDGRPDIAPDRSRQHDRGLRSCSTSCAAAVSESPAHSPT